MGLVGPRRGPLIEDPDGSRQSCRRQCDQLNIIIIIFMFVLIFLSCDFVRGFEEGRVRIVIELGVLKSDERKRVG